MFKNQTGPCLAATPQRLAEDLCWNQNARDTSWSLACRVCMWRPVHLCEPPAQTPTGM